MKIMAGLVVALASSAAFAQYQTVDFSAQFNMNRQDSILGSGGTFPVGNQTFNSVPFAMGGDANTATPWAWSAENAAGSNPRTLTVPTNIAGATTVYSLINTFWGQGGPNSYASITFNATGGLSHTVSLVGNVDVRDYNQWVWTNTINGTTTQEVFNNNNGQRMDMQTFTLPAAFASQTLTSIVIDDNGGSNFQRVFLMGLTVQVPAPGAAAALAIGWLAGFRRRR